MGPTAAVLKTLIIINLLLIVASLASGVIFLAKDNGKTLRVVQSLTIRVALSFTLIMLLLIGYFMFLVEVPAYHKAAIWRRGTGSGGLPRAPARILQSQ